MWWAVGVLTIEEQIERGVTKYAMKHMDSLEFLSSNIWTTEFSSIVGVADQG